MTNFACVFVILTKEVSHFTNSFTSLIFLGTDCQSALLGGAYGVIVDELCFGWQMGILIKYFNVS